MKIVILTTESLHHTYFIQKMIEIFDIEAVFYETKNINFQFDVSSPFATEEHDFELHSFFTNISKKLPLDLKVIDVETVNHQSFSDEINLLDTNLALVFGCGFIKPHVIDNFDYGLINIHRGIAPLYRGLDSDLWAIYHNDFNNIGVTLHYINEGLDTGDILFMDRIELHHEDRVHQLRYKTTKLATEGMKIVLSRIKKGEIKGKKQEKLGRYYSAMPAVLKPICVSKFNKHIKSNL